MEVVWEANPTTGVHPRRAPRACQACQKRKKKCRHISRESINAVGSSPRHANDSAPRPIDSSLLQSSPSTAAIAPPYHDDDRFDNHSRESPPPPDRTASPSPEPIRVGDLHPESLLAELSNSPNATAQGRGARRSLGLINSTEAAERFARRLHYDSLGSGGESLSTPLRNYLEEVGAFRVLPRQTQDTLVTAYISCIDGIMPILDGGKLLRDYASGSISPFLINAVALVSCKTEQAVPHLRLEDDGPILNSFAFARNLYDGLEAAMRMELEPDRIVKVQILALMSLHHDGRRGIQKASSNLHKAIYDAWFLSLHYEVPTRPNKKQCYHLWWTLRALDRLSGCWQGHPLIVMDRDIDLARPSPTIDYRSQIAAVSLRLGDITDDVINVYRPQNQRQGQMAMTSFPSFGEIVGDAHISTLRISHRNYLEIWYLALSMLSCRASPPNSPPYRRRVESARRVQELTSNGLYALLPPLPIIAYAVSLSLTVAYRTFIDIPGDADAALAAFRIRLDTLKVLGKTYHKAQEIFKLGRAKMQHMTNVQAERQQSSRDMTTSRAGPSTTRKRRKVGQSANVAQTRPPSGEQPAAAPTPASTRVDSVPANGRDLVAGGPTIPDAEFHTPDLYHVFDELDSFSALDFFGFNDSWGSPEWGLPDMNDQQSPNAPSY